jgi:hypothetical protein
MNNRTLLSRLPLAILNQLNALFTGVQAGIKVTQGNTGSANFVIQTDGTTIDINSNNQLEVKPSYAADFVTQAELTEALDTITGGGYNDFAVVINNDTSQIITTDEINPNYFSGLPELLIGNNGEVLFLK